MTVGSKALETESLLTESSMALPVEVKLPEVRKLQAILRELANEKMPTKVSVPYGMAASDTFRAKYAALNVVKANIATLQEKCVELGRLMESVGLLDLQFELQDAISKIGASNDLTALNQNQTLLADSYKKYLGDFTNRLESSHLQVAQAVSSEAIEAIKNITYINHTFIPQPSVAEQQEKTVQWSNRFSEASEARRTGASLYSAREMLGIFKTGVKSRLTQVGGHLETIAKALQPPSNKLLVMPEFEQERMLFMLMDKKGNYNNLSEKEEPKLRELLIKACKKCAEHLPEPLPVNDGMKTYELIGIFERMYDTLETYIEVQAAIQDANEKMGCLYSSPLGASLSLKLKGIRHYNEPSYWDRLEETFIITNLASALAECHTLTLESEAYSGDKSLHDRSVTAAEYVKQWLQIARQEGVEYNGFTKHKIESLMCQALKVEKLETFVHIGNKGVGTHSWDGAIKYIDSLIDIHASCPDDKDTNQNIKRSHLLPKLSKTTMIHDPQYSDIDRDDRQNPPLWILGNFTKALSFIQDPQELPTEDRQLLGQNYDHLSDSYDALKEMLKTKHGKEDLDGFTIKDPAPCEAMLPLTLGIKRCVKPHIDGVIGGPARLIGKGVERVKSSWASRSSPPTPEPAAEVSAR